LKITQGDNLEPDGDPTPDKARWVALYWDSVYKLLYRLSGGNRHEAEDLAQETFLKAIERSGSFTAGTNLRAWLSWGGSVMVPENFSAGAAHIRAAAAKARASCFLILLSYPLLNWKLTPLL